MFQTGFRSFSLERGELLFQEKLLTVVSSLGHLSIKKFSDQTYRLDSKIRQREDTGGWQPPWTFLNPIFLTIKMTINLKKIGME